MIHKESLKKMGNISLINGHSDSTQYYYGNIGYSVNEEFRRRGLATRSTKLIVEFAKSLGQKVLWIITNPDNIPSMKVAKKCGFRHVDTLTINKEHRLYKDGDRFSKRFRLDL